MRYLTHFLPKITKIKPKNALFGQNIWKFSRKILLSLTNFKPKRRLIMKKLKIKMKRKKMMIIMIMNPKKGMIITRILIMKYIMKTMTIILILIIILLLITIIL